MPRTDLAPFCGLPFALEERVGVGRTGETWRGVHLPSGRPVAVKVLAGPRAAGPRLVRAARAEFRRAAAFDHPGLAVVVEFGVLPAAPEVEARAWAPGAPWWLVEWHDEPVRGPLPWPELRRVLLDLLDALAHVHAHGLTHGAVRPGNVFRSPDGGVRLADFGAGRIQLVAEDLTDLRSPQPPCQQDFEALGALALEWAADDAPGGLRGWVDGLGRLDRPGRFRSPAAAAAALAALDATGPALGPDLSGEAPQPPASWRRPGRGGYERRAAYAPPVGPGSRPVPLVGVDALLDALWSAFRTTCQERRARAVCLCAPEGLGKTALARAVALRAAETTGARVLGVLHGPVLGPDLGLTGMVVRLLGCRALPRAAARRQAERRLAALGVDDPALRRDVADLVAREDAPDGGTAPTPLLDPGERRERVLRLLAALSARAPVVLLVHDAQWGLDALTLVEDLAREGRGRPVLAIVTVRDDLLDRRPEVARALERLSSLPPVATLRPRPLSPPTERRLLAGVLRLRADAAEAVAARARGSPLVAIEMVRALADQGLLVVRSDGTRSLVPGAAIPDDIEQVWLARLRRFLRDRPAGDGLAVELAAVLGGIVDEDDWEDLCERAGIDPSEDLVDDLLAAGLAVPAPGGGWMLAHGTLVRTLVRRAMRAGRIRAHHRACAELVADHLYADANGGPDGRLHLRHVRHLVAAGEHERALPSLLHAARTLLEAGEVRAVAELLDAAAPTERWLEHRTGDHRLGELRLVRAELAAVVGDGDDVDLNATRAEAEARRHGWRAVLGWALVHRARLARGAGNLQLAGRRAQEALRLARTIGDRWLAGGACLELAASALAQAEHERAAEEVAAALLHFDAVGDRAALGRAHVLRARLLRADARPRAADEALDEALAAFAAAGRRWAAAEALVVRGLLRVAAGDVDAGREHLEEAVRLRSSGALPADEAEIGLALADLEERRWRSARWRLDAARQAAARAHCQGRVAVAEVCLAWAAAGVADWEDYDRHLGRARAILRGFGLVDPDAARAAERAGELAAAAWEPRRARRARRLAARLYEALGWKPRAEEMWRRAEDTSS